MVYNASVVEAYRRFSDRFYYLKSQAVWAVLGIGLCLLFSKVNYQFLKKLALPIFVFNLILLVLVLIQGFGSEIKGARRWLNVGGYSFQPSELMKLSFVIYLATWLSEKKRSLGQFLFLVALVAGLIILEPDLGTSLVIVTSAFVTYYLSGAPVFSFLATSAMGAVGVLFLILISPYRRQRLLTFFSLNSDPLGASYHVRQALIALGNGGWFGLGLGQSRQKYSYLPEVAADSIFAIVGEEVGFLGSSILLIVYFVLIYNLFKIATEAPDKFSQLLATAIGCWFAFQTILNLSAMVVLVPLTGIPLPLISHGGSSLVITLIGIGITLNISRFTKLKLNR